MRADAQRNRDKIVEVARTVFREQGYDASLDLIAKQAGVGAGTLYRHFPTRDALLDEIMATWIERVRETTDKALVREGSPRDVLLGWFEAYVGLISLHKGGPAKITSAMGDPASPILTKCQVLAGANQRVLDHLAERGALRPGVSAMDVVRLVGGVATVADTGGLADDAVRPLLTVIADGILV